MASFLVASGDEPTPVMRSTIRVGSRKSQLALVQTNWVVERLKSRHPDLTFEVITLDTVGDNILDRPLSQIGEKALFTRELEEALLAGNVDLIVHSLKDLPTTLPDKCCIGAITSREDPTDSLVFRKGLTIPSNSSLETIVANIKTFGTSSLRRIAQLRALSPQVDARDVRGNLTTRFRKLDNYEEFGYDCLVLATAGLKRGGFEDRISHRLSSNWYHAVGQGALGVECRLEDQYVIGQIVDSLVDSRSLLECTAERVLMKCLEGGCSVPIGVRTHWQQDRLTLEAIVLSLDGTQRVHATQSQILTDVASLEGHNFTLHDYADVAIDELEPALQIKVKNSVILGRRLAAKMIDMNVRDILAQIARDKTSR